MMDQMSTIQESSSELTAHLAARLRTLRAARGLTLDALARASGVSRSMISLIERGQASATAVVLERLATALGLTLAALFDAPAAARAAGPVARRSEQTEWCDPGSGYRRRNVTPAGAGQPMHIVEVHFPPGARVAFETGARRERVFQQVWLLEGRLEVTLGAQRHQLREGDCLAMELDAPTMFRNPTRRPARYAVVLTTEAAR